MTSEIFDSAAFSAEITAQIFQTILSFISLSQKHYFRLIEPCLVGEISVSMNKVEGEKDEDEEAEHSDADGGDGDEAAGAEGLLQGLRQLGDAVTRAAVGELALPIHIARPHPEIQAPIHICNNNQTILP